jgi:hypothetical protein
MEDLGAKPSWIPRHNCLLFFNWKDLLKAQCSLHTCHMCLRRGVIERMRLPGEPRCKIQIRVMIFEPWINFTDIQF